MTNSEKALQMHETWNGKIKTTAKSHVNSREDLAIAYTPGVAEPCKVIAKNPDAAYKYTIKANTIAVVSDGSAVLGLGNIGAKAAMPVMEGKAVLFKEFGGVNAVPICLDTQDTEEIIRTVVNIAPAFGGINLEDISAPRCFEIEERLKELLDIPVFHDDQHGTAIVVLAGIINALKVTGKEKENCRVVINGAGSAGVAITKLLLTYGFSHVTMCDINGIISQSSPNLNWMQKQMAEVTNLDGKTGTLAFFGCPAEEQGFGKGFMAKARCFDGVDMMFTWHPADQNVPMGTRMVANYKVRFDFTGISAHAGAAPEKGRSALDACELMNVGVNYMREHVISDARIHYAYLDNGGEAPNVVQDHASLLYFMRAPKLAQSSEILARIKKIAQGAALMTETEIRVRVLGGLSDVIPNPTAFQVLSDAYVEMGGPEFDEEDYAIARKFLAIFPEDDKKAMAQKMAALHKMTPEEFEKRPLNSVVVPYSPLMRQKVLTASSDVGDVSYLVPTAQLTASAAIPGTGHHTWQYTAQVGTSIGGKACLAAAKAIGLACTRIFNDPALADQAKKELLEETGGVYVSPIPDDLTYVDAM